MRKEKKDHGLGLQIEGIVEIGKTVVLIDPAYAGMSPYTEEAEKALMEAGLDLNPKSWTLFIDNFIKRLTEKDIGGKTIVGLEDLVSTGESSLKEFLALIGYGTAIIPVSIFDYELKSSKNSFTAKGLYLRSVLNFKQIIAEFRHSGNLPFDDEKKLWDWYDNQPNWGDENGFPSVKG